MKHPHKVEKQNKGFSLVEVLVTLAVICILSIPVIQNFISSANTNKRARTIQNATDIAQSVSEYFDAMPLRTLMTNYMNKYSELDNGSILFNNIGDGLNEDEKGVSYYLGGDKEKFYVSVILDPSDYNGDENSSGVNDYQKPDIHNLNENSSITCRGKLDQYDRNIVNAYKEKHGIVITSDDMSRIVKESTFRIQETESTQYKNSDGTYKIEYRYYLDIKYTYTYTDAETNEDKKCVITYDNIDLGIGILDTSAIKAPNLYIIYTPMFAMYGTSPYSEDKINIEYRTTDSPRNWEKTVNIYLVQQEAYPKNNTTDKICLKTDNISIKCYSGTDEITKSGSFDNNITDKLNFFTNVKGWDETASLTYGTDKLDTLYTISVYVWKDEPNGITFNTDGNMVINGDYYTVVTNVKED